MRSFRGELIRSFNRGNVALVAGLIILIGFAMANAVPQGNAPIQGFWDVSIFLAVFLMGRAATTVARDCSSGSLRPWLISDPRRFSVFAGKLGASVAITVITAVALLAVAWILTAAFGRLADLSTILTTGGEFLLACIALTFFGHAAGLVTRSVPVALTVTLGWILPAEAVVAGSIVHPDHWLPGLLLRSVTAGVIPPGLTTATVIAHALLPFLALEVIAVVTFLRRDITC